jgi:hypothetical protein
MEGVFVMINFRNIQMVVIFHSDKAKPTGYAIRRGWFIHKYFDLDACQKKIGQDYWWSKTKEWFWTDCVSEDRAKVKSIWRTLVGGKDKPWSENVIYNP